MEGATGGYDDAMNYRLSRLMSTATAGYAVFAFAKPDHLATALQVDKSERGGMDLVAKTYGVRDLAISAAGITGSPATVRTAMKIRIANDVGDGIVLALRAKNDDVRQKALAVTMGWAALNSAALLIDSRRAKR